MERKPLLKRLLSGILAFSMAVSSMTFVVSADNDSYIPLNFREVSNGSVSASLPGKEPISVEEEKVYADDESVRVSIVLDGSSTIEYGYEVQGIAENAAAMSYRGELEAKQNKIVSDIEKVTNKDLDVVWNLTLAANIVSANVEYGQIKAIEKVKGVKEVLIEDQYFPQVVSEKPAVDPNMATSNQQIGSNLAWNSGYTGAGSRVAVIDTGTDDDHQSFAEAGYLYSLQKNAEKLGISYEEYVGKLNLLTMAEIDRVKDQLNAGKKNYWAEGSTGVLDPEEAFFTQKLAFNYNYVDHDYDINHDSDEQGEHGSHVAGIATANSWIKTKDGYEPALEYAHMQGVAPDAQLLTMKVFGKEGGAYPSDYMAAIEDAIILEADSINLSLGAANPGHSKTAEATYQAIMDNLTKSGVVVSISAGNSGFWSNNSGSITGNLYATDVSMQMNGAPGSFTNAFTVASVDNIGITGSYFAASDGSLIFYIESPTDTGYNSITTLSGEQEYILITGLGYEEDWAMLGDVIKDKIVICSRGDIPFADKANAAVKYGAAATIIYNNEPGQFGMLSEGYNYKNPFVSITMDDGEKLRETAEEMHTEDYYV
ncbi:MAG: S8 family serine peptidase, partial [Ruminiclostridium sp.]|nr:S8 family serine peptidase [Ruminiclostridium sp.]